MSADESFCKVNVRHRDNKAAWTLKEGFSVVAPTRVMVPASTGFKKTSCCDFENRCISSQNIIVLRPVRDNSLAASWNSFLHSAVPQLVALISMKRLPTIFAIHRAIVVLPVPEPPHNMMDGIEFDSIKARNTPVGPTRSWPATSSRVVGRIRSARGAARFALCFLIGGAGSGKASVMCVSVAALSVPFGDMQPGPSSKDLFVPTVFETEFAAEVAAEVSVEPFMNGVSTLEAVACRLAPGVAKKSAADRLDEVDGGGALWDCAGEEVTPLAPLAPLALASSSRTNVVHWLSIWLLISEDLTFLLHIGHVTIFAVVAGQTASTGKLISSKRWRVLGYVRNHGGRGKAMLVANFLGTR